MFPLDILDQKYNNSFAGVRNYTDVAVVIATGTVILKKVNF